MADKLDRVEVTLEEQESYQPGDSAANVRKRRLILVIGGLYSLFILAIAIVVGSLLYEVGRSYSLSRYQPPDLEQARAPIEDQGTGAANPSHEAATSSESEESAIGAGVVPATQESISILLLGTDERPDENGPPRTDTMMVVTLDPQQQTAGMISLPRDLWVPIPEYDITTKINTAYVLGEGRGYPGGGPQLAKDTVSSFIGRSVDYYVRVNFDGFVRFIDEIGGIDVHVPVTIHDDRYPTVDYGYQTFHLDAGYQHLDGDSALKYVRTRNADSDYRRAERQQQVLKAVLEQVLTADMLPTLISRAPQLTAALRDSFSTDIPLSVAIDLANYLRHNDIKDVRRLVVDSRYGDESHTEDGVWILLPNRKLIREALAEFFAPSSTSANNSDPTADGDSIAVPISTDRTPTTDLKTNSLSDVRLEILNGTGYPGVAARLRESLEASGWKVIAIGDADRSDYRRTLIVNYNADDAIIHQMNSDLHLPPDLPTLHGLNLTDSVDIRIIIGQDFLKDVLNINTP